MQMKAMSTGASRASRCASVTCSARTGTENSGTSLAWVTRRPCFLMCSTCSGHGSMNVTSSPACAIWAPAYPPTAPAPTIAIFRAMLSSRHYRLPRLARRPGSAQMLNRVVADARRHSLATSGSGDWHRFERRAVTSDKVGIPEEQLLLPGDKLGPALLDLQRMAGRDY